MRKSTLFLAAGAALLLALVSVGCNGSNAGDHPVSVTLAPISPQSINAAQSLHVTAAVAFDSSNRGVGWSLQGPGSLGNRTTSTVTYLAPTNLTEATPVTITASSLAFTNVKASLSVTVNPFSVATTSLPHATLFVPYTFMLQAAGGVPPFTWSISSGALPGWANLDSSTGLISGIPDMSATTNFTVQAADSAGTPEIATRVLPLTVENPDTANNAELNGHYAFLLQGFDDATGNQFAIAGSFIADANGNITGGIEDSNGPEGYLPAVSITGRYSVGADNRGFGILTTSGGKTLTFALAVGALNSSNVATTASMIEFDDITGMSGRRGAGRLYLQDSAAFNPASVKGSYAFQMVGQTATLSSRRVTTGAFTADGKGSLTKGDSETMTAPGGAASQDAFTGTVSATPNTAQFGRVTLEIQFPGGTGHTVSYIVDTGHALLMTTDPELTAGLESGQVLLQNPDSLASAPLKGTSVVYNVGLGKSANPPDGYVNAGLVEFDGFGDASVSLDVNDSGRLSSDSEDLRYTVFANGRVEMVDPTSDKTVAVAYLADKGTGFTMNLDSTAAAGFFEQQMGKSFSNASISGSYFSGTVAAAVTGSGVASGMATSTGKGTLNATLDSSGPMTLLVNGQTVTLKITIGTSGRGTNQLATFVFYVVSPNKFILMNATGAWPTISIFQQ